MGFYLPQRLKDADTQRILEGFVPSWFAYAINHSRFLILLCRNVLILAIETHLSHGIMMGGAGSFLNFHLNVCATRRVGFFLQLAQDRLI
jgi:hypothetical protein